jgi:hypothetical protein
MPTAELVARPGTLPLPEVHLRFLRNRRCLRFANHPQGSALTEVSRGLSASHTAAQARQCENGHGTSSRPRNRPWPKTRQPPWGSDGLRDAHRAQGRGCRVRGDRSPANEPSGTRVLSATITTRTWPKGMAGSIAHYPPRCSAILSARSLIGSPGFLSPPCRCQGAGQCHRARAHRGVSQ